MGHYASDMGYHTRRSLASWMEFKPNPTGGYGVQRQFPYETTRRAELVSHEPCGQVFDFDIWSEDDTAKARAHHYSCPALHDTVNPGPLA